MADIATLRVTIDSTGVVGGVTTAVVSIDQLKVKAKEGASANKELGDSLDSVGDSAGKLSTALTGVAGLFALRAAKEALQDVTQLATRYQELGIATQYLGQEQGVGVEDMRKYQGQLQEVGFSGISARESLVLMAGAQLSFNQTQQLGAIAAAAAVNRNLDFAESMNMVVRGIESGRTIMLRQMGIVADFNGAYKEMATQLGTTAKALDEHQKMQARLNAVVEAGSLMLGEFNKVQDVAGGKIRLLTADWTDFKTTMGEAFLPALVSLLDTFSSTLLVLKDHMELVQAAAIAAAAGVAAFTLALGAGALWYGAIKVLDLLSLGFVGLQLVAEGAGLASLGFAGAMATIATGAAVIAIIVALGAAFLYAVDPIRNASEALKSEGISVEEATLSSQNFAKALADQHAGMVQGTTDTQNMVVARHELAMANLETATSNATFLATLKNIGSWADFDKRPGEAIKDQGGISQISALVDQLKVGTIQGNAFKQAMMELSVKFPRLDGFIVQMEQLGEDFLRLSGRASELGTWFDKLGLKPGIKIDIHPDAPELEKTRNAVEQLTGEIAKGNAAQLKGQGNLVDAAMVETLAENTLIETKYKHMQVQDKLASSLVNAAIESAKYIADTKIHNTLLTELAANQKIITDAQNAFNDAVSKGADTQSNYLSGLVGVQAGTDTWYHAQLKVIDVTTEAKQKTNDLAFATNKYGIEEWTSVGILIQATAEQEKNTASIQVGIDARKDMLAISKQLVADSGIDDWIKKLKSVQLEMPNMARSALATVQQDFTTFFTVVTTNSQKAFSDLFNNILKAFETMVAQMAERGLIRALFGSGDPTQTTQSILDGIGSDISNWFSKVAKSLGATFAGALAGAVAGISVGQATGSPLAGGAAGAVTGFTIGGPVGGVVGGIAGVISGLLGQSSEAAAAAAAAKKAADDMAAARLVFQGELNAFVKGITSAGSSFAGSLDTIAANSKQLVEDAGKGFGYSAAYSDSFLGRTNDQLQTLITNFKLSNPEFAKFLQAILDVQKYSDDALLSLRNTFHDTLVTQFFASMGDVGKELNSLTAIATQRAKDLADAGRLGVLDSSKGLIDQTFMNSTKEFLTSLSTSQLDALMKSLTGDTLAWAQAIATQKHATDEAIQALKDQTTQTGYLGRIAQATGSAADAAAYRHAQETDEMNALIASHAGPATIAMLAYTQSIEDNAAAAKKATDNLRTSTQFSLDVLKRDATLSGDPEQIKYANLAILKDAQKTEIANAQTLLDMGIITQAQFDHLTGTLSNEFNHALITVDGTINGITESAQHLADAAKILADNVASLNQQFDVMGTSLSDQITTLEHAYGLDGLSLDQLRSMFVPTTLGQELSPADKELNNHIQQIVDLIYKLPAAGSGTGTTGGTSGTTPSGLASTSSTSTSATVAAATAPNVVTNQNTTPIIVMDGNVIVQVMLDPNQMNNGTTIGLAAGKAVQALLYRRLALQMSTSGSLTPVGG